VALVEGYCQKDGIGGHAALVCIRSHRVSKGDSKAEHNDTTQNDKVAPAPPSMRVKDSLQLGDGRLG
jgi:hypothetical protein